MERRGCGRRSRAGRQGALLAPEHPAGPAESQAPAGALGRRGTLRAGGRLLSLWCDRSSCPGRDSVFLKRGCSKLRGLPLPFRSPPPALGSPSLCARQYSPESEVHPCPRASCQQRELNVAPVALRCVFFFRTGRSVKQPLMLEPVLTRDLVPVYAIP